MIRVDNLNFRYAQSDFCLRITELVIAQGTKVALVGPSGSGKTTLLNLMAGITLPQAGRMVTDDVEISSLGDAARRDFRIRHIGLVFQEFELLDHLTVFDNMLLAYRMSAALKFDRSVRERAVRLAQEVDIGDKLHRPAGRLSQGERQRVALCRALLPEPPLLLCDEPTGNLDPGNKEHVLGILAAYVDKTGATMVTVTHDHEVLPRFDTVVDFRQFHTDGSERT